MSALLRGIDVARDLLTSKLEARKPALERQLSRLAVEADLEVETILQIAQEELNEEAQEAGPLALL